jgi:hypothetical protein
MRKLLSTLCLLVLVGVFVVPAQAQTPATTITFVNPPAKGILELNVGQSYTLEVQIQSDQPFLHAQMAIGQFFPGRNIFADGMVVAHRGTQATLLLTVRGKAPTTNLPGGATVAPETIVVGVRYPGGMVVSQEFQFGIIVH